MSVKQYFKITKHEFQEVTTKQPNLQYDFQRWTNTAQLNVQLRTKSL